MFHFLFYFYFFQWKWNLRVSSLCRRSTLQKETVNVQTAQGAIWFSRERKLKLLLYSILVAERASIKNQLSTMWRRWEKHALRVLGPVAAADTAVHSCRLIGFFVHRSANAWRSGTDEAETIWMDAVGYSWLDEGKLDSGFQYTADSRNRTRFWCLHFLLFWYFCWCGLTEGMEVGWGVDYRNVCIFWFVCFFVWLFVSVCLFLCLTACVSVGLFISLSDCVCLLVCLFLCLIVCVCSPSVGWFVSLSDCVCLFPRLLFFFFCVWLCMSVGLWVFRLLICFFLCLIVCLPISPSPNSPWGLCGRKATLNSCAESFCFLRLSPPVHWWRNDPTFGPQVTPQAPQRFGSSLPKKLWQLL